MIEQRSSEHTGGLLEGIGGLSRMRAPDPLEWSLGKLIGALCVGAAARQQLAQQFERVEAEQANHVSLLDR